MHFNETKISLDGKHELFKPLKAKLRELGYDTKYLTKGIKHVYLYGKVRNFIATTGMHKNYFKDHRFTEIQVEHVLNPSPLVGLYGTD